MAQQYENYWALTVEYTDIDGPQFRNTLQTICEHINNGYVDYAKLTIDVNNLYNKVDLCFF